MILQNGGCVRSDTIKSFFHCQMRIQVIIVSYNILIEFYVMINIFFNSIFICVGTYQQCISYVSGWIDECPIICLY